MDNVIVLPIYHVQRLLFSVSPFVHLDPNVLYRNFTLGKYCLYATSMNRDLLALPRELIEIIFAEVTEKSLIKDVVQLRLVCRYFNEAFYSGYYVDKKPIKGIPFPTCAPITGDFLHKRMKCVRFRGRSPQWGEFEKTVQQTVKDLLQYSDQYYDTSHDQYSHELCSMAAEFNKIWYPLLRSGLRRGVIRGKGAVDHTLVALAYFGMTTAFESLLPPCQNTLPTSDHFGKALHWAICRGHTPIVNILQKRQRQLPSAGFGFGLGRSELSLAAQNGHLNLVKLFILQDDDTSSWTIINALHSAAQAGQLDALKLIIGNTPRISSHGNWPLDVLLAAAHGGQDHIVGFALSEHGANIDGIVTRGHPFTRFSHKPAIYAAASHGYVGTVSYLLAKGAHFSGAWGNALTPAVRRGYTRTIEVLLEAGADLNTVDSES